MRKEERLRHDCVRVCQIICKRKSIRYLIHSFSNLPPPNISPWYYVFQKLGISFKISKFDEILPFSTSSWVLLSRNGGDGLGQFFLPPPRVCGETKEAKKWIAMRKYWYQVIPIDINILSWNAMYTFDKLSNCRWCPAVLGQLVNSPSLHCTDRSSPAFHFMSWFSQQWSSPAKYLDLLAPALNQVFLSEGSAHNAIRDGGSTVQSYMCLGWIELLSKQCKYLDLRKWKIVMGLRLYLQLLQDKNPRSWGTLPIGR